MLFVSDVGCVGGDADDDNIDGTLDALASSLNFSKLPVMSYTQSFLLLVSNTVRF